MKMQVCSLLDTRYFLYRHLGIHLRERFFAMHRKG
jgi:hypothetical protein